jgi:hypothetical protein
MKLRMKPVVAGAAALAVAGAGLALAAPANAYTGSGTGAFAGAPGWVQTDAARKGSVLFYDANGAQITGGANIQAVGSIGASFGYLAVKNGDGSVTNLGPGAGAIKANALLAAPDPTNAVISTWATTPIPPTNYTFSPAAAGVPASVSANPAFVKLNALGQAFQDVSTGVVLYTGANAEYKNVLEIRVKDTVDASHYWATDIEYNPTGAASAYDGLAPGEWKVIWPGIALSATSVSAVSSSAGASYNVGTSTDLSATVTPTGASGNVVFKDGATVLGTVANPATGAATLPGITLAGSGTPGTPQSHSITAQFVPTAYTPVSGSTSAALGVTVNTPAQSTAVNLVLSGLTGGHVSQPNAVTATASVTWNAGATSVGNVGTVQFIVDGTNYGSPVAVSGGSAALNISTGSPFATGAHSVSAHYSDGSQFNPSDSAAASFTVDAPAFNPDTQAIESAINPGTITISTPYDGSATKASYCAVGTDAANTATFGKVYYTAAAVGNVAGAVAGAPLPVWASSTQQNTTACGFLFVPALSLNGTASLYSSSATFDGISVTDTRPGNNAYTLNALATNMSKQGVASPGVDEVINAQNIGLTALALDSTNRISNNLFLGGQVPGTPGTPGVSAAGVNYTGYDNPAAAGVASNASGAAGLGGATGHQVLHATIGLGTIVTHGTIAINAPTNTRDGVYAGALTFTVLGS